MAILPTDIKILWSRAAGLCSMPECRKRLTPESQTMASGAVIIGDNCHIVAESMDGPRGNIPIAETDRNRYPNLILLCRDHHKIIDTDIDSWPVEKLYRIKSEHENWVSSSLQDAKAESPEILFYKHIVNEISKLLMFNSWDGISDHAIRNLAYEKWIEGIYLANVEIQKAVWPKVLKELENSLINLVAREYQYAEHYLSLAWKPRHDSAFYQEDRTWKRVWRDDYDQYQSKSEQWASENMRLLMNITHAMNEFSDSVRAYLDPYFFRTNGRFCIHDSEGVTNMLTENWILPSEYRD